MSASGEIVARIIYAGSTDLGTRRLDGASSSATFKVETVDTAQEALEVLEQGSCDGMVSDYDLPGTDGLELLHEVRAVDTDLPFVLFANDGSERAASEAIADGVDGYVPGEKGGAAVAARLEEALRDTSGATESERRYRNLVETSPAPINVFDENGRIVYSNQAVAALLGVESAAALEGQSIFEFIHPEDRDLAESELAEAVEAGEATGPTQMTIVREGGGERDIQVATAPGEYEGEPVGQAVIVDITDLRQAERELRAERRFIQDALDTLGDMFYVVDTDGELLRWNTALAETTGYSESELDGMTIDRLLVGEDIQRAYEGLETAIAEGHDTRELTVITKSGETLPVEVRARRLTDQNGDLIGVAGIGRGIRDRLERERQLEHQRERLSVLAQTNHIVRDINASLVTAESRAEVERVVCERLAETGPYRFAWIGGFDRGHQRIIPQTTSGQGQGYLDTLSIDVDGPTGQGPAGRALRTGEVQTNFVTDDVFEPVREAARTREFTSVTAIPITYQNATYGVLTLYSGRGENNVDLKTEVLQELGLTIGAAINAVERKRALLASPVVELTIEIADETEFFTRFARALGTEVRLEKTTPQGDGSYLFTVSVDSGALSTIEAVCDRFQSVIAWTRLGEEEDESVLELRVDDSSVVDHLGTHGSTLVSLTAHQDHTEFVAHIPKNTDIRSFIGTLRDSYDGIRLVSQQQRTDRPQANLGLRIDELLTERQQEVLETAYFEGYFEPSRERTGAELAETLGISGPTFHSHLRQAQRRILSNILEHGNRDGGE